MLWNDWWLLVCDFGSACARTRTFLWMALCLTGITIRKELLGVTSIVRALGLEPACYDRPGAGGPQIAYQQPPIVPEHARPPQPVGWDIAGAQVR